MCPLSYVVSLPTLTGLIRSVTGRDPRFGPSDWDQNGDLVDSVPLTPYEHLQGQNLFSSGPTSLNPLVHGQIRQTRKSV